MIYRIAIVSKLPPTVLERNTLIMSKYLVLVRTSPFLMAFDSFYDFEVKMYKRIMI